MGSPKTPSSVRRAEERERRRQQQIKQTTARIDQIFDSPEREAQYETFLEGLRGLYGDELNERQKDASRNLKFAMAGAGLTGGSAALDAGRNLRDEYQQGLLRAERESQGAVARLRDRDMEARTQLTSLAQTGLDSTTAARRAAEALRSNLTGARSSADVSAIGDVFAGTAEAYKTQQEAAERRRGYQMPVGSYYGKPWGG